MKLSRIICAGLLMLWALAGCKSDGQSAFASNASGQAVPSGNGVATLSWDAPTTTTTGAALTDLAGYHIYYGTDEGDLTQNVQLKGVGVQTYVIDTLGQGTWYFAVKAVTSTGVESSLSNIVSKTIS